MKRVIPGLAIILLVLFSPAVRGQEFTGWSSSESWPRESDGELVLTFWKAQPGRIVYWTSDGACSGGMPWVDDPTPTTTCEPAARAPEDYGSVSGEIVFTEAGSRQIRVPIVDDDSDEGSDEAFMVHASEGDDLAAQTTWYSVVVHIVDNDGSDAVAEPAAVLTATTTTTAATTSTTALPGRPVAPLVPTLLPVGAANAEAPAPVPATESAFAATVEVASGDLQPGPGFELLGGGAPGAGAARGDGGATPGSQLTFGLGGVAATAAAAVWVRRRRRWSSKPP